MTILFKLTVLAGRICDILVLFLERQDNMFEKLILEITQANMLLKDLISDFYLTSLQLVLCRLAAVKRLPVHQP